ncbi:hypothetical protein HBE96_05490 [Clostridium sp. P21]|uniref:Uncharacterized protein n=1 Tax=Clostridium muellerianum TaxID=2716538 RepID=A0A7Y0EEP2_9CLOT|nr:hypothetical protein [Clostridium muellerianum]NMM62149.1 hypothetical protein [Clostridium muellerianum]
MKNFLISALVDIIFIFASYFIFRKIISGPIRHRLYEKLFSSFAKFVIYIFVTTVILTSIVAWIFYRTRFVSYLNVIAPALVSILIGFFMSLVPTRGKGDDKHKI